LNFFENFTKFAYSLIQEPEVYNANLYRAYALNKSVLVLYKCQVKERAVIGQFLLYFKSLVNKEKNRESIRDATAELQVKIIWSNWIPFFKNYQCYVPSINLLAFLVHKKKIFKY
jgi:hypothetical protein